MRLKEIIDNFSNRIITYFQTLEYVESGNRMTQPQVCPDHLWSITWSCWNEDPMKRPTFESLQNQLEDFVTGQQNQYHSAESQFG